MSRDQDERFRFRQLDSIGAAGAEEDQDYLEECFLDTGYLTRLRDCAKSDSIVVGRTGVGKTALLRKLIASEERCVCLSPEHLSLSYISNSNVIAFFDSLGVSLDFFYRFLWRHVIVVEVLKNRFSLTTEESKLSFVDRIRATWSKSNKQAIRYLERWGDSFWADTEVRISEIIDKVESDVSAAAGGGAPFPLSASVAEKLTHEERQTVRVAAQQIVDKTHARELGGILEMLDDVLADQQKKYFVCIDGLDDSWVDSNVRTRLIKSLVETVKDFRRVRHAKVVIALRLDLLRRVFRLTRTEGFQEEKYEALYLHVRWTNKQLEKMLDLRVSKLVRERYRKNATVLAVDVLPKSVVPGSTPIDYILERTLMRPRDAILFFNECIALSDGNAQITGRMIRIAEGSYSSKRLRALADEWFGDYPNLTLYSSLLQGLPRAFDPTSVFDDECLLMFCLNSSGGLKSGGASGLSDLILETSMNGTDASRVRNDLLKCFYDVGLIEVKMSVSGAWCSSIDGYQDVSSVQMSSVSRVRVHLGFCRELGVKLLRRKISRNR